VVLFGNTKRMDLKEKNYHGKLGFRVIAIGIAVLVVFAVLQGTVSYFWGVNEIDHFLESTKGYTAKYYVNLFQENDNKVKVPADVYVEHYCDTESCARSISVEKAYFENGSYLSFEDCELDLENTVTCVDQNHTSWNIEFKKEKIK